MISLTFVPIRPDRMTDFRLTQSFQVVERRCRIERYKSDYFRFPSIELNLMFNSKFELNYFVHLKCNLIRCMYRSTSNQGLRLIDCWVQVVQCDAGLILEVTSLELLYLLRSNTKPTEDNCLN